AALVGGAAFEPREANPMLGFRGASRYAHPAYAEGFALEWAGLRRVRAEMGLANLLVMVPFCRRVAEAETVLAEMARHGLKRGVDRDSDIVAFVIDERDPGMLEMLRLAVSGAQRNRRKVGICGEAPANYPEIARFLAGIGIDSISVNPSSLLRTIAVVREAEQSAGTLGSQAGPPSRQAKGPLIGGLRSRWRGRACLAPPPEGGGTTRHYGY